MGKRKELLSISEIAKISRLSRSTLIYYDRLGLLSPVKRGNNKYRYYSYSQITSINLIVTMQELGMPLKDIADLVQHRTPESVMELFSAQSGSIDLEIERRARSRKLLLTLKTIIEDAMGVDEEKIEERWIGAESILLGPQISYSRGKTVEQATYEFYKHCEKLDKDMDMNYPVWGVYSEERIKKRDWRGPDRFYFRMPDAPDQRPEGLYLIGYARGNYGQTDGLYKRMMSYIEENNLEISGPTYETYPLNEISILDSANYLIRIFISVKHK
jgi:DNA-binding transcriptional MerR regulator